MVRRTALLLAVLLPACDDGTMHDRQATRPGTASAAVADPIPPGSVPRGALPVPLPEAPDAQRGAERFAIFCTPCHGMAGGGDGAVVRHGFPAPPSFHAPEQATLTPAQIVGVITNGTEVMPAFGARIPVADRWAIAAHVKALQERRPP